jgi:hypothetical protein
VTARKPLPTTDDIRKWADKAMAEWIAENAASEEQVRGRVREMMERHAEDIIAKVAGFDNSWGRWEVDHCNGRMSQVTRFVSEAARTGFESWLKEQAGGSLPALTAAQKKALRTDFVRERDDYARTAIRQLAQRTGAEIAEGMVTDVLGNVTDEEADSEVTP